jgi:hypothetical protein
MKYERAAAALGDSAALPAEPLSGILNCPLSWCISKNLLWFFGFLLLQSAMAEASTNQFRFDDLLIIPLRIHLLQATNSPVVKTTLGPKDIQRIVGKVNRVWGQAGLQFYIESILMEPANDPAIYGELAAQADRGGLLGLRPTNSLATNLFHVYYLKKLPMNGIYLPEAIFVKDTASLREVAGGLDEPLPRVTSHELGHALGLPHRQDTTNLMASGTTGAGLNEAEIEQARASAKKLGWVLPAPALEKTAASLWKGRSRKEAIRIYSILADLPRNEPRIEDAKKKVPSLKPK